MLPSALDVSRNKWEYFPNSFSSALVRFSPGSSNSSLNMPTPDRAWFAAALLGTRAAFPAHRYMLDRQLISLFAKKLLRSYVHSFCCHYSQGLQWEQEPVPCCKPKHITLCCLLSPSSSRPYLLHQEQGAERGSHACCLHKGSNSSPGVSCFGSVA